MIDTSNFKPFDINPYLTVLRDLRDVREKTQEKLERIEEQAGQYILPEGSPYKEVQDNFYEDLAKASDAFGRNENDSIRNLKHMFRRYRREMLPINTMIQNYNKDLDKVWELKRSNPSAIVQMGNLEDYYGNANSKINYINGEQVAKEVSTGTKSILSSIQNNYSFATSQAKGYLQQVESGKLSISDLYNIASHPSTPIQVAQDLKSIVATLQNFYDGIRNRYSYEGINKESKDALNYYVNLGVAASATPTKTSLIEDRNFIKPENDSKREQEARNFIQWLVQNGYKYNPQRKGWVKPASKVTSTVTDILGAQRTSEKDIPESFISDEDISRSYGPYYIPNTQNSNQQNSSQEKTPLKPPLESSGQNLTQKNDSTIVTPVDSLTVAPSAPKKADTLRGRASYPREDKEGLYNE